MSGDEADIVDLTAAGEAPARSPTQSSSLGTRRKKIRRNASPAHPVSEQDSDLEIVDIQPSPQPPRRPQQADDIEIVSEAPAQDVDIVEERTLTAEERLKAIREKHARGEHVQVNQNSDTPFSISDSRMGPIGALFAPQPPQVSRQGSNLYDRILERRGVRRGGPPTRGSTARPGNERGQYTDLAYQNSAAFAGLPLPAPPFANAALQFQEDRNPNEAVQQNRMLLNDLEGLRMLRYSILSGAGNPSNYPPIHEVLERMGSGQESGLEHSIMQQALDRSLNETHRAVNPAGIKFPEPPTKTHPGFTRSLNALADDETVVCISCGHELGKPRPEFASGASERSANVFVRGCGHVYCGECTFSLRDAKNKKRACPMKDSEQVSSKKKNQFRQVFI